MDQCINKKRNLLCSSILSKKGSLSSTSWMYEDGVVLKGLERVWRQTGKSEYFDFIKKYVDTFVTDDGRIPFIEPRPLSLDNINNGKCIFTVYRETPADNYKQALDYLWNQLKKHPRIESGGLYHKQRYPGQMWLDGLYMAQPFAAEYASVFHLPEVFDDIALQFRLIHQYTFDPAKSLYYHAYDSTKSIFWCNKETGQSPNFWGRAMGWLGMAAVDCLDFFPPEHPGREDLICILVNLAAGLERFADDKTYLWYQVVDRAGSEGNYIETSCSCMFAYTLQRAAHAGYIAPHYMQLAAAALDNIWENYVTVDAQQLVSLHNICQVAGLGPEKLPHRDGSYEYYIHEPVVTDDNKGVGALLCLLAAASGCDTP